jgi:hypothetical protein
MAYDMKPGQGSAFPNEKKVEDWHADFRGKLMLPDGKTHWVDITNKKTKDGKPWVSIKIGNLVQQQGAVYSAAHQPFAQSEHERAKANAYQPTNPMASSSGAPGFDDDGDIPF